MDVVLPVKHLGKSPLPVLIFMNAFGGDSTRTSMQYTDWMKLAAGNGFVAVTPDTHFEGLGDDLDQLVNYLRRHAADLGVDPAQIGVWACSGHAYGTLPLVEDAARTAIKAAVMYYGGEGVAVFRLDLPVLLVRAGLDRPNVNRKLDDIAAKAVTANAPVTLLNYAGGHHGFDAVDDNDATRAVISETLRFFKTTLTPSYQAALRQKSGEIAAAGAVMRGDWETAVRLYRPLAETNVDDLRTQLAYGEALLGAKKFREALAQFEKLRGKAGIGPRDRGLPAAMAAAQAGDAAAAIGWLKTIPPQALSRETLDDPAFRSLEGNAEFEALKTNKIR